LIVFRSPASALATLSKKIVAHVQFFSLVDVQVSFRPHDDSTPDLCDAGSAILRPTLSMMAVSGSA
jgi:hypothetical protein